MVKNLAQEIELDENDGNEDENKYWTGYVDLSLWVNNEQFTVPQAAALICGYNPIMVLYDHSGNEPSLCVSYDEYEGKDTIEEELNLVFTRLVRSIKNRHLYATADIAQYIEGGKDWGAVRINRDNLIEWLIERENTSSFCNYLQEIQEQQKKFRAAFKFHDRSYLGYLNPENPRYAPKLAAAIRAWQAVEDPKGKHPAQAIREWLTRNAKELGLLKDDGKPNKSAIEDIAKIANWQPKGGAPKTPG